MKRTRTYLALLALAVAAVLVVSACGGSSDSGASAPGGSGGTETVSVSSVDGVGDVLVDAQGAALYAADQETNGMVVCTGSCTSIWDPLTVTSGRPTAGDGVTALGVVTRPDGARQVTVDGRPLYRFTEDPGTGVVTGNGFADSFAGKAFTWHVATPTGISTTNENSTSSSGDSSGSLYR
jgi:predicted lipoprotein with Yx(FWY)xxD motif